MNKKRSPRDSEVIMTEIVLPQHSNALGTVFGGQIVSWIDIAAAIAAMRHSRKTVVTASIDAVSFLAGAKIGDIIHLRASVNYVWRTSMEVGVRVESEDPKSGRRIHTASAYATFVALDAAGVPTEVPPILPHSRDDRRRSLQAQTRRAARIKLARKLRIQK